MLKAGWERTPNLKMLCGGETLPRGLANKMLKRGRELWNMYGPTETTIWSSLKKVKEVVVFVWEDKNHGKRLVAYIITFDEQEMTVSDLRKFLKEKLPEYMIPSLFVKMDKFPLTPNAKVDRKALPQPDTSEIESESRYIAPREMSSYIKNFLPILAGINLFAVCNLKDWMEINPCTLVSKEWQSSILLS